VDGPSVSWQTRAPADSLLHRPVVFRIFLFCILTAANSCPRVTRFRVLFAYGESDFGPASLSFAVIVSVILHGGTSLSCFFPPTVSSLLQAAYTAVSALDKRAADQNLTEQRFFAARPDERSESPPRSFSLYLCQIQLSFRNLDGASPLLSEPSLSVPSPCHFL